MEKIEVCPKCGVKEPPLTLTLEEPEKYQDTTPDTRVYALICLNCEETIDRFTIDNTIVALVDLRAEMDKLYGEAINIPPELIFGG